MRRRTLPTLKGRGIEAAADPRDVLPPGWIRVESRSKPGTFYYAHPATKKTQLERPVDPRYAQREKPKAVLEPKPAPPAPVQSVDAVTVDDDSETLEEKQRKEEERKAEQKAREEAEEKEREEVLLRARQRRAQQMLEEEKRRKEEEEQEEEERQRAAERRREKKEAERLKKEEKEKLDAQAPKPVALGRRDAAKAETKRRKKAEDSDPSDAEEVTLEELEKWKASEEQHEREEAEAKRRKIEEEERRKAEAELAEKRKKAEFEEAVARARRMKSESNFQKQEELRRPNTPDEPSKAAEPSKAEPAAPAAPAAQIAEAAEPPTAAVPPPQTLQAQPQPPAHVQASTHMQFPFQFVTLPQVPRPPAPPPPPPPTPPTLANLLSGAVAKPDFGKLLKQPKPSPTEDAEATAMGPQTGTVLWYNGRRKCGMILADRDSRRLRVPTHAANMGGIAPPVPAGLMHGTRVNFMLDSSAPNDPLCVQVRPLPSQIGLSCGGDSQAGQRLANEDRTIATDLQESLGHMVGIFDGHRGTACADYLSQELPKTIVQHVREAVNQEASRRGAVPGAPWESLTEAEEVDVIRMGIVAGLEATDRNFLNLAQQYGFKDGAAALIAIVMHGFQSSSGSSSVTSAPGGQARLFAAWSGTGHVLLLRGRQVLRCTEDHVVNRDDERRRLAGLGAHLVQDLRGIWWAGRPGNPELAWARQQCYDDVAGPKTFMAASRGFGDIMLKGPPYPVLAAAPEVQVMDLCPDDWAIVLATRGVFSVLNDQDVANACWDAMAHNGQGPQEAAQIVTQRALQLGARSNLTCIVMRLGWAKLPS